MRPINKFYLKHQQRSVGYDACLKFATSYYSNILQIKNPSIELCKAAIDKDRRAINYIKNMNTELVISAIDSCAYNITILHNNNLITEEIKKYAMSVILKKAEELTNRSSIVLKLPVMDYEDCDARAIIDINVKYILQLFPKCSKDLRVDCILKNHAFD